MTDQISNRVIIDRRGHRFARYCIDVLGLTAGELMAVGGWESETVVRNRYYNVGQEHADSALSKF